MPRKAKNDSGWFKGVNGVAKIDSAASRMLQLADLVAYSRKWLLDEQMSAALIHERFGIKSS